MALKGLDIFKLTPKTNCKECGNPTCMAFSMKVAQGAIGIEKCPYMSEEAKATLNEANAPAMKTLKFGAGETEKTLGGETVEENVQLLIAFLRKLNDDLRIPHCIKNYGADSYPCEQGFVPEEAFLAQLPEIAKNAIGDACTGSNPRQPSQEEMEKLLKCCYYDTEVDF